MLRTVFTVVFLVIVAGAAVQHLASAPATPPAPPAANPAPVLAPVRPLDAFRLAKTSWGTGGFDTVALFDFTFANDNAFTVKDATVSCDFYAPSGTYLGRNARTIYEKFPPKSKRSVHRFNFGFINTQAKSATCTVTAVQM